METNHTPGPWTWTPGPADGYYGDTLRSPAKGYALAEASEGMTMADTRLIAAAPELLEALRRLAHPMADDDDLDFARKIIAKAEGRA